ncbi:MAG TPA: DNA-processing protein DprA [Solirubrobacteraceae bacterium]
MNAHGSAGREADRGTERSAIDPVDACTPCLARSWLLGRLAGHLDRHRDRLEELLGLGDAELIAALGGRHRETIEAEYAAFDPAGARSAVLGTGSEAVCRCRPRYPPGLLDLEAPPAVLHIAGGRGRPPTLLATPGVAIVGSREPSPYGSEVAAVLGRGLGIAGVTVISGLARGIDASAQRGAIDADGPTVAVLAGAAERPYPPRARALHRRIVRTGAVLSEMPPGTPARRWMFPARNRIIAALSALTVVVEARAGSGAMITAAQAERLQRRIGAVPGRISSPLVHGPHELLRRGALLVDGPECILEALFGPGGFPGLPTNPAAALDPASQTVLDALAAGADTAAALARARLEAGAGLAVLAGLELSGLIVRRPGGGYAAPIRPRMAGAPRAGEGQAAGPSERG